MSAIREVLFSLLFNAILQVGLFAVVAAALSPFVGKAKAKYQHSFYLGVLILCLAAPVTNTLWRTRPSVTTKNSPRETLQQTGSPDHSFWGWKGRPSARNSSEFGPGVQSAIVAVWGLMVLYQLIHFGRGSFRVHRLRKEASPLSPAAQAAVPAWLNSAPHQVSLLESTTIHVPVTAGVFRPVIVLPSNLMPGLGEQDLSAVIAHEYGHIQRRDFPVHVLCEVLALPVFWHPGIRYLKSKVSQTRELACDEYAAVRLGKRHLYARTLLRLASLCLHATHGNAMGLSIFNGDNLEDRIMRLTEKRNPLSRVGLVALVLAASISFGSGAMLARATSLQATSGPSNSTQAFAGTWHWMFKGRSFSTMILTPDGTGFSGSVTGSKIALDDQGYLSKADPSDESTPSSITKAVREGNALHVTLGNGDQPFEFLVTLKDDTHAEIHPVGAPANMKPIPAEKVR
jgi:beta-lactamase regulating signal transducer with metallopeptidase domain